MVSFKGWILLHMNYISIKVLFFLKLWPALLTWWWEHKIFLEVWKDIIIMAKYSSSSQCSALPCRKILHLYLVELEVVIWLLWYRKSGQKWPLLKIFKRRYMVHHLSLFPLPWLPIWQVLSALFCNLTYSPGTYYFCTYWILSNCRHLQTSPEGFLGPLESAMSIHWADWKCQGINTPTLTPTPLPLRDNSEAYFPHWLPGFPCRIKFHLPSVVACLITNLS